MSVKIEHRLGLPAPAEAIWAVIADFDRWSEWNPLYPRAEGALRIGSPLSLDLALPGRPVQVIKPVILDWDERLGGAGLTKKAWTQAFLFHAVLRLHPRQPTQRHAVPRLHR